MKTRPPMKASTRKLLTMLPSHFELHIDVVDGAVVGADVKTPDGKPTGIDPDYPGFTECLTRLLKTGHVFGFAERVEGTKAKHRAIQSYITCRAESGPDTATKTKATT